MEIQNKTIEVIQPEKILTIFEKLQKVQIELKAPKSRRNNFGKYRYRSLEDILEALKPLQEKYRFALYLEDEIIVVGNRFYVKCVATLQDLDSTKFVIASAFSREPETKKGMDESQLTGTASSYARKYACNGLFLIDDTQDADTDAYTKINQVSDFDAKKYKPLLSLITEVTGEEAQDYFEHLESQWKMGKWGKKDADRFIKRVRNGELENPF